MEKFKLILTFVGLIAAICGGIYWISLQAEREKIATMEHLRNGCKYSKGIITDIHYYKGHTFTVRYIVNGGNYEYVGNWDSNVKKLGINDSVAIKYAIDDPNYVETELQDGF